MVSVIVTGL